MPQARMLETKRAYDLSSRKSRYGLPNIYYAGKVYQLPIGVYRLFISGGAAIHFIGGK